MASELKFLPALGRHCPFPKSLNSHMGNYRHQRPPFLILGPECGVPQGFRLLGRLVLPTFVFMRQCLAVYPRLSSNLGSSIIGVKQVGQEELNVCGDSVVGPRGEGRIGAQELF